MRIGALRCKPIPRPSPLMLVSVVLVVVSDRTEIGAPPTQGTHAAERLGRHQGTRSSMMGSRWDANQAGTMAPTRLLGESCGPSAFMSSVSASGLGKRGR